MIKYKNKYTGEKFVSIIRSQFKLVSHIGTYALIHCMVKGNRRGYFVIDVSQKPHTFYELKHKDFGNLVGLTLCWEEEKDQYDEEVDIPFAVMTDIICRWEKAV